MQNSRLLLVTPKTLHFVFLVTIISVCSGREVLQANLNRTLQTIPRKIPTAQPQHPGNGNMVAFNATTRAAVDAFHAAALAAGGSGERAPGLRPALLRDLDGNKLCVVCHDKNG